MSGRDARRRRILEGGQDRLALITGRKNDADKSQPQPSNGQSSVSATYIEEEKLSRSMPSVQYDQAVEPVQSDLLQDIIKEPFVRKPEPRAEPSRAPPTNDVSVAEPSPVVPKPVLVAADVALQLAQKIPLGHVSAQQVNMAVAESEYERMFCTLIVAALVILSYAGFPILGSRILQRILLFRPLFLLVIADLALIVRRLFPLSQKNVVKGEKEDNKSILGDGFAWAEDAGRALELGLMLQSVMGALFTDCTVYAAVLVFFLAPFV